jgi:high frequency lysogenization protein
MNHTTAHRALAMAGIFQAAYLVQQIARRGSVAETAVAASINSRFQLDPDNAAEVCGGIDGLALGLGSFSEQLDGKHSRRDPELLRYVIGLLYLERQLARRDDLLQQIRHGIESLTEQAQQNGTTQQPVIAALARLYQDTVSTLTPRLMVHGEPTVLADVDTANLIRALLLAAIRAAVLWRQCGGRRWRLLIQRSELLGAAQRLRTPSRAE